MHQHVSHRRSKPGELVVPSLPRPVLARTLIAILAISSSFVLMYQQQLLYNETLYPNLYRPFFFTNTASTPRFTLVLIAHDRDEYFRACLVSLQHARRFDEIDLIVSMDYPPYFERIRSVVSELGLTHRVVFLENPMFLATWFFHTPDDRITNHYRRVLETVFDQMGYDFGIFLETDLVVSRDFIEFMFSGSRVLREGDDNIFCVSAWNDNGFEHLELREDRVFRTDFFPGLGWMIHRSVWCDVLRPAWPSRFGNHVYDMWIRYDSPLAFHGECIAPQVSRTHHIARYGTHVIGEGHYTAMPLASGETVVEAAEWELVKNLEKFENRIRNESLGIPELITMSGKEFIRDNFVIPLNKHILVIAESGPLDSVSDELQGVLTKLGLFGGTLRSSHKGLIRVELKTKNTTVTVLRDAFAEYWDV
jgi:beta-1,2-N-acetylglucosaminyltransferase